MNLLLAQAEATLEPSASAGGTSMTVVGLLNTYALVFAVAFVVSLIATPVIRRIAVAGNVVDHPDRDRKSHDYPVAYLGGVAVFFGVLLGIAVSYAAIEGTPPYYVPVPMAIVIGMLSITFTGLADDVWGWDPRLKIAGQAFVAAAALALENVGVRVAEGLLRPMLGAPDSVLTSIGSFDLTSGGVYYWAGTVIIAVFVLGGCNAANLIDGLDGLLTGVVAIVAVGLLAIALMMAVTPWEGPADAGDATLSGARIVLCLAVLGAMLGFLPYNFNPASIFLGDCGSHLLGYLCVAIILMFGEQGQTHLVFAGLVVFSIPIIDTMLAIIRRVFAGVPMSRGDDLHMHHHLKRALRSERKAVLALYGIGAGLGLVGVLMAALAIYSDLRIRIVYMVAAVLFCFVAVLGVKSGRHQRFVSGPSSP